MLGLLYGIPAYRRQVSVGHVIQSANLTAAMGDRVAHAFVDSSSIDFCRNSLIHMALRTQPARWLLMCDADTYHYDARDIVAMLADAEERRAAVMAAPVQLREWSNSAGAFNVARYERITSGTPGVIRIDRREVYVPPAEIFDKVTEVDLIGTAFMLLSMDWIGKHWPNGPWFQSKQTMVDGTPAWLGEDFRFCDEIKDRGGHIYCDGRFQPVHHGTISETSIIPNCAMITHNRADARKKA